MNNKKKYAIGKNPNSHKPTKEANAKRSESLKQKHKEKEWGFIEGFVPWNKDSKGISSNTPRHSYDDEFREKIRSNMNEQYANGRKVWNKGKSKYSTHEEYRKVKNEYQRRYRKTIGELKFKEYRNKRKRNLGFFPLFLNPFPEEIQVDYHHINNMLVVPIPTATHMKTLGKTHREKMNKVLEKYYGIDFYNLLQ